MSGKHSDPVRGLMSTAKSPMFDGRFGRMFRQLPGASFGKDEDQNKENLRRLGEAMSADLDLAKDGPDEEESTIPALYTYFGQFVDHDITFDPASTLQQQNDPDALIDFRTPAFDLDNVYGRGPGDQPYLYDGSSGRFLLGDPLIGGDPNARDLPRNRADPARALIGDPRNDENAIVSQLQGLFLRFHNRFSSSHSDLTFEEVQRQVRYRYQYVVLNDFLPRIVHSSVLADLKSNGKYDRSRLKFFHWSKAPFLPVEFSVAVYRLGHSMVRPGYRLNDNILLPIFPTKGQPVGLTGFKSMVPQWGIDWGRLVDIDSRAYDGDDNAKKKRLQFAYRIDTSLVKPLANLPASVAAHPSSLAERNLLRSWRLGLPSGQAVAQAMKVPVLGDEKILIGKDSDQGKALKPITEVSGAFARNCPLWTYILAEARYHREPAELPVIPKGKSLTSPRLGPVGGRLAAEVFLGLLFGDGHSYLNLCPDFVPDEGPGYALRDFVKFALG